MLNIDAQFPQIYSRALLVRDCRAALCKITQDLGGRGRAKRLQVSLIGEDGASAVKRVTLGELISAAPLSAEEEAELQRLEKELACKARPNRRKLARHEELRHRYNHAEAEAERERRRAERDRYEMYRAGGRSAAAA